MSAPNTHLLVLLALLGGACQCVSLPKDAIFCPEDGGACFVDASTASTPDGGGQDASAGDAGGTTTETECSNGLDDDHDGLTDCADPDCDGLACDDGNPCTEGEVCVGSDCQSPKPPCATSPDPACREAPGTCDLQLGCTYPLLPDKRACSGGCTNKDGGCCGSAECTAIAGQTCEGGACACPPGQRPCGSACIEADRCCRGADCADAGMECGPEKACVCPVGTKQCNGKCVSISSCCTASDCGSAGDACDSTTGLCKCGPGGDACPEGRATCNNGKCGCGTLPTCSSGNTCQFDGSQYSCVCPASVYEICNDGIDNDCNGAIDCADATCGAKPCDDHDACTADDACSGLVCVGKRKVCASPPTDCYQFPGQCDPMNGNCNYTKKAVGAQCSGNLCFVGQQCDGAGSCTGGTAKCTVAPPNGSATCANGACDFACDPGFVRWAGACANFGGSFQDTDALMCGSLSTCLVGNPWSGGGCGCPANFSDVAYRTHSDCANNGPISGATSHFCTAGAVSAQSDFGGVYERLMNSPECPGDPPCPFPNPFTNACDCPAGMNLMEFEVLAESHCSPQNPLEFHVMGICMSTSAPVATFGGAYVEHFPAGVAACSVVNPRTGACTCFGQTLPRVGLLVARNASPTGVLPRSSRVSLCMP